MSDSNARHRKRVIRRQQNPDDKDDGLHTLCDNEHRRRTSSGRRKLLALICSVCEGSAHGYNFDTITCESCKAFFRRNALRTDGKLTCRTGDNQCLITESTRKRCKSCRLAKCFAQGMRADWILTEEERINKRLKIEENRRLRQMLDTNVLDSNELSRMECKSASLENEDRKCDLLYTSPSLSTSDLVKIDHIQQAYASSVRLTSLPPEIPSYPHRAQLDAAWSLMNLPTNLQSTRLITFFKLLPEFATLNEHDKLILIKYNTFSLVFIRSALIYDPATDSYHDSGTDDCVFDGKDLIRCLSLHQYQQSTRCVCRLMDASQNDHLITQILLLITLFSKGSSMCTYIDEPEPVAEDISSIYRRQNIFIDLLWKYCEHQYGWTKTIDIWLKLVIASMDAHLQAYNTRYDYVKNDLDADRLVPLMQSVILNV